MANMNIIALYVGLNALLLIWLSINVGINRGRTKAIEPGSTADHEPKLMRAIRAHGNYTEYAPAALLLLLVLAQTGQSATTLHILGGAFTGGRVLQAIGMMQLKHPNPGRMIGTALTLLTLLVGGILCILAYC